MGTPLQWHEQADVCGIQTQAFFFDPEVTDIQADAVARLLPVFTAGKPASLLWTEEDRRNFTHGDLIGQPDSVFEHGNGLLSLEYKSVSGRSHTPKEWPRQLALSHLLQAIGGAMVVAAHHDRPTAAFLRCHNALYQLDPRVEVLDILAESVGAAKAYWGEDRRVSITQLAKYCEPKISKFYRALDADRTAAGVARHKDVLRR